MSGQFFYDPLFILILKTTPPPLLIVRGEKGGEETVSLWWKHFHSTNASIELTLSWRWSLSYRNWSTDFRHERVNTRLLKFLPPWKVNLHGPVFLERINHWLLAFPSYVNFFEHDEFSEWCNRYFWGSRNQNCRWPNTVDSLLKNFFFLWILHFGVGITVIFLRKQKKSKSYLNFSFYHYHRFSRISKRKWEILKSTVYHKRRLELDSLLGAIVINTLNSPQFWKIRCFHSRMPFLKMSDTSFES